MQLQDKQNIRIEAVESALADKPLQQEWQQHTNMSRTDTISTSVHTNDNAIMNTAYEYPLEATWKANHACAYEALPATQSLALWQRDTMQ